MGVTALIRHLIHFSLFSSTVFLSFLCIFESWLTELTQLGDVIALRFLLFLSHTYGVVLLLTTPLIAVETLSRLLWPHSAVAYRAVSQRVTNSNAQRCYVRMETVEEEEADGDNPDKDIKKSLSYVVSYLCCLSVWVVVALNVRWRWKLEEVWAAVCLHKTNSLIRCLPNLFSPMSSTVNPCWVMAFLSLLLILLTMSMGLQRRQQAGAQMVRTQREKHGVNNNGISYWQDLVPALTAPTKTVNPGTSVSECVDPEKTESSCTVHRACSWNSAQMLACHHGDFVLISPECLSAGQEPKTGIPVTFSTEDHVDSEYRSQCGWLQRGFPCLEVNVMIEFVGVLSIFVLPLNLSVNILLIRTIETLLEQCIKSLVTSAANANSTYTPHKETPA